MPDENQMRGAVQAYARAWSTADIEGIVSLFAEDGTFEDPIGSNVMRGRAEIRTYVKACLEYTRGPVLMEQFGEVRVAAAGHAACAFIATCAKAEQPFRTATLDTFAFNAAGLFSKVQAYFGPSSLHPVDWTDSNVPGTHAN